MSKSKTTEELERSLYRALKKQNIFRCFEVTLDFPNKKSERVDMMTLNTKGEVRCYEIKSCKSDFYSKAKHTFVGNFNYYVLSEELYDKVKDDIPKHVGVHNGSYVIKNAKKVKLGCSMSLILKSMVRSLCRDSDKWHEIGLTDVYADNTREINMLNNKIKRMKKQHSEENQEWDRFLRQNKDIKKRWMDFEDF